MGSNFALQSPVLDTWPLTSPLSTLATLHPHTPIHPPHPPLRTQFIGNEDASVSEESLIENKFMKEGSFDCAPGASEPVDLVTHGKTVTIKLKGKSGSKITSRKRPEEEREAQNNVYWQLRTTDDRASSVLVNIISARTGRSATMVRQDTALAVDGESGITGSTPCCRVLARTLFAVRRPTTNY